MIDLPHQVGGLTIHHWYDDELNPVDVKGHRFDCRCETCRPDIVRLP